MTLGNDVITECKYLRDVNLSKLFVHERIREATSSFDQFHTMSVKRKKVSCNISRIIIGMYNQETKCI